MIKEYGWRDVKTSLHSSLTTAKYKTFPELITYYLTFR